MQAWRGQYDTRVRRAADAAAAQREKERERAEDEACVAALAAVEANLCEQLPVAAQATAMPHAAEAAEDAAEPTIVPEVARPADQVPAVPPVEPPPPRFIEHKQQRLDPGKPLCTVGSCGPQDTARQPPQTAAHAAGWQSRGSEGTASRVPSTAVHHARAGCSASGQLGVSR